MDIVCREVCGSVQSLDRHIAQICVYPGHCPINTPPHCHHFVTKKNDPACDLFGITFI